MNAPRASVCAFHGSGTGQIPPPTGHPAKYSSHDDARRVETAWSPSRMSGGIGLLGLRAGLLGGGVVLGGEHRRGSGDHVLGELALGGEQLLSEVVGVGDQLARLG